MCGRYANDATFDFHAFDPRIDALLRALGPRYNVAPAQRVPVILWNKARGFELADMRWGLVPHWSKQPATRYSTINARVETVEKSPAFRGPFSSRRCLVPASGFYEWKAAEGGGRKQPFYFCAADGRGVAFAGLWDEWRGGEERLLTCAIVTAPANALVRPIHDRMPAILPVEGYRAWLDAGTAVEALRSLLVPCPAACLRVWPVSAAIGSPRNEGAELIDPV